MTTTQQATNATTLLAGRLCARCAEPKGSGGRKYCADCAIALQNERRRERALRKAAELRAQGTITVPCAHCGEPLQRMQSTLAQSKQRAFCDADCRVAAKSRGGLPRRVTPPEEGALTPRFRERVAAAYGVTWHQLQQIRHLGLTVYQVRLLAAERRHV
jgi:hypothetical protein